MLKIKQSYKNREQRPQLNRRPILEIDIYFRESANMNWKIERLKDWKIERLEDWKIGRLKDWKIGRLED